MDGPLFFKSFIIAIMFLGVIAFAAIGFRPGSASTVGQGGSMFNSGYQGDWGDDDHDDD